MDILYLLIPLSVILVLMIIGALAWALYRGQFDDLEHQGELVFDPEEAAARAAALRSRLRQSAPVSANTNACSPPRENPDRH